MDEYGIVKAFQLLDLAAQISGFSLVVGDGLFIITDHSGNNRLATFGNIEAAILWIERRDMETLNSFARANHYASYAEMLQEVPEVADIDPEEMRAAIEADNRIGALKVGECPTHELVEAQTFDD